MGWGGRASKRGGGGGGDGGGGERDAVTSGCMCAVFQFFDFHHIQLPNLHHQQDQTIPKVVEAPKHSLGSCKGKTSLSCITKEEETLNSHILKIQPIKTSGGTVSDSSSFLPATKTPTLVARLMGLDLLPESHSPSSISSLTPNPHYSKPHLNPHPLRNCRQNINANGTRSLPETPRVSSSSSRRSDVDHRLSLQINKENVGEELEFSKMSSLKRKEMLKSIIGDNESGRSPSHYARQIVKQVKENIRKRVGLIDVTNTIRNDQHLLTHQSKSKKASTNSSCSPRPRLSEVKNINPSNTTSVTSCTTCKVDQTQSVHPKQSSAKPKKQSLQEKKRRKNVEDGFSPSKLKKQEEAFVRPSTAHTRLQQRCKKAQLISNNLINLNNFPTLLPIKKVPQKQLSSSTSQSYKLDQGSSFSSSNVLGKNDDVVPNGLAAARTTGGVGTSSDVRQYVMRILSHSGINKYTRVSFTKWFSPSHPLDPSIFHHLENYVTIFTNKNDHKFHNPSQLKLKCNRKLVFHVVDEILVEILNPYLNLKPWVTSTKCVTKFGYKGSKVIDIVCERIEKFPGADCRILEDIDALIDEDLPDSNVQSVTALAFEEEGEGLVTEIEKDIMDTLMHDTAMCLWFF